MQTPVLEHRENEAVDISLHPSTVADSRGSRFIYGLESPELLLLLDINPARSFCLPDRVEMDPVLYPHTERRDLLWRELALRWHLETGVRVRDRLIKQALGRPARDDRGPRLAALE